MRLALFVGCKIPAAVPAYETSARAVLARLGVELVPLDFGCCGYPQRSLRLDAYLLLAARNLALAAARGLDLLTLCQCCYGSLRFAQHLLAREPAAQAFVRAALDREGLALSPATRVRHLLDLLGHEIGPEEIAARARAPRRDLVVAAHYGCHALRPSDVVSLDNPHAPTIFERLLAAAGARTVDWARRLECCGAPIGGSSPVLASRLRAAKLADAQDAGAGWLCTACPWCHEQLAPGAPAGLRVALYPQLLGLALGLGPAELGLGDDA
ncbi:MAG: heterodisulfide reductase-related iron-sulfur binding cluster [Candidatus Methylomirabilota bacterium]